VKGVPGEYTEIYYYFNLTKDTKIFNWLDEKEMLKHFFARKFRKEVRNGDIELAFGFFWR